MEISSPTPSLITTSTETVPAAVTPSAAPAAFVPDPTKSTADNELAKTAFEKTAAEAKIAADAKAAEDAKASEAAKANDTKAIPFKLEEIKLPDGVELDPVISNDFVGLVNKFGLGRDAVNELVALQAKAMTEASAKGSEAWNNLQDTWKAEITADPVFGGAKLPETLGGIAKIMDKFGTPEVRAAFDLTGAGNNPHIIKFLAAVARNFAEGTLIPAGQPAVSGDSAAKKLFPNQN